MTEPETYPGWIVIVTGRRPAASMFCHNEDDADVLLERTKQQTGKPCVKRKAMLLVEKDSHCSQRK